MTTTEKPTALVPGAHRTVRVLSAAEGPFRGTLVSAGDGVAVLADADDLAGWAGWRYAGSEHVAGPNDLVRRADGQDVLLPWCTETVDAFLGRRAAGGAPPTAGEVSTLVVSLLRGVCEVHDEADVGDWWLTDGGRPVFVIGDGGDARAGAAAIVGRLRREGIDRALGRLLDTVHDGLLDSMARPRMPVAQLERWEAELFEIAAPRALDTAVHAPERVRGIEALREREVGRTPESRRAARRMALGSPRDRMGRDGRRSIVAEGLRSLRGAVATSVQRIPRLRTRAAAEGRARGVRPGVGASRPSMGKKVVVAGAAAVLVVIGGAMWPGGATGESLPPTSPTTTVPTGSSANPIAEDPVEKPEEEEPALADETSEPSGAPEDPVDAAAELITAVASCAEQEDATCAHAVAAGAGGALEALSDVVAREAAPSFALVDSYGDVAVVRLKAEASADEEEALEMMLVLVRIDEKWLVRDVYDVADQPR